MDDNSFYSLDKLVEFGMGMAIAQQMIGVMNQTLNNMYVPNAGVSLKYHQPGYFAIVDDNPVGPLLDTELQHLVHAGKLSAESFVWTEGMPGWKQVKNVPQIYKYIVLKNVEP